MKFIFAFLLLATSTTLMADDLLNSATNALKGKGGTEAAASSAASGLSSVLGSTLGVSPKQAEGGLGSLFGLAQSTLEKDDFSSLASAVPGMDKLLSAAPATSGGVAAVSGLAGNMGGYGDAVKGASNVVSQFQSLGLDAAAIPQYIEVTNEYLQSNGGKQTADMFLKGVSSLL